MANGYAVLFFHLSGYMQACSSTGNRGALLQQGIFGITETPGRFRLSKDFKIFGVCFQPFVIPQLLNISAAEINNGVASFPDVLGAKARNLETQLAACSDDGERAGQICTFIRSRLALHNLPGEKFTQVFTTIAQRKGNISVAELADEYCLSRRTFERRFRTLAGLSPKAYANVVRFQSVFDTLTRQQITLTDVAYQHGYYDQAHFNNDFNRFSAFNPKSFTTSNPAGDPLWLDFVAFFQFLSWCPPVLCTDKHEL